jgi:glycosyltransferase involved in cell wall biosynthesis
MGAVSYLLTSYNKAAFLPCVLESIRREHADTGGEIIIIDDGSTDGSSEICRNFADSHPATILIEQSNRGVYAALNRIIPIARAPWIRLCDSDDPLIRASTRYLIKMASFNEATIAYGGAIDYGPDALPFDALELTPPFNRTSFVHSDAILHLIQAMDFTTSRAIYRAGTAKAALPLPENLVSCQDFALALRMTARGRLVRLRDPVCFYMSGAPNQLSASLALTRHQTIRILQSSGTLLSPHHRRAAITAFYKWRRRELRKQVNGMAFQLRKNFLKAGSIAAKLGFCDWNRALDRFAAPYEKELGGIVKRRITPY